MALDVRNEGSAVIASKPLDKQLGEVDAPAVMEALAWLEHERARKVLNDWVHIIRELRLGCVRIEIVLDDWHAGVAYATRVEEEVAEGDSVSWGLELEPVLLVVVGRYQLELAELWEVLVDGLIQRDDTALDELQGSDVREELSCRGERNGAIQAQGTGAGIESLTACCVMVDGLTCTSS